MQQSDEELVRLHLQGDGEAFRELVQRYTGALYNLAYRYTADRMAAEDITQETFLRVYRALPRSRLDLPFKPWLFRIAANLCRDWVQSRLSCRGTLTSLSELKAVKCNEKQRFDWPLMLKVEVKR